MSDPTTAPSLINNVNIGIAENGFIVGAHGRNPDYQPFSAGDQFDPAIHDSSSQKNYVAGTVDDVVAIVSGLLTPEA